jgi:AraC-like DNA-binding protein
MIDQLILFLPAYSLLFWGVMFLCLKHKEGPQKLMTVILLISAISNIIYIYSFFYHSLSLEGKFAAQLFGDAFALLFLPLEIRFIRQISNERPLRWWNNLIFLIPVTYFLTAIIFHLSIGLDSSLWLIAHPVRLTGQNVLWNNPVSVFYYILQISYDLLFILQLLYFILYLIVRLIQYRQKLFNYYTDVRFQSNVHFFETVVTCLLLLIVIQFVIFYYPLNRPSFRWLFYITFLLYTISISVISYCTYQAKLEKQFLSEDTTTPTEEPEPVVNFTINPILNSKESNRDILLQRLDTLLMRDKIFLEKDLQLDIVASYLHTNRTYVSRLINEECRMSFSDFINTYRVRYAEQLMLSNPSLTQAVVSEASGFIHNSSFIRVFKHLEGCTPTQWLAREKENAVLKGL